MYTCKRFRFRVVLLLRTYRIIRDVGPYLFGVFDIFLIFGRVWESNSGSSISCQESSDSVLFLLFSKYSMGMTFDVRPDLRVWHVRVLVGELLDPIVTGVGGICSIA